MNEQKEKIRMRDVPPTGVRLAPELKNQLMREASINGRTLHAEILHRLQQSLAGEQSLPATYTADHAVTHHSTAHQVEQPAFLRTQEKSPTDFITEIDRAMLGIFRRLPPDKQLALLSLFR